MSFFNELRRRNVFRVGIAYLVVSWLTMQVADVVINNIGAPAWVFQVILLILGIGLPLVLIIAWAFEMTPEGIKKEKDVDRSQSITPRTGKKLNNTILGLMALAIVFLLFDKFSEKGPDTFSQEATVQVTQADDKKMYPAPFPSDNSIAVLPFANRSNVEDDLFFTDGIHDDLLTQLAKISGLKVISRTSVMEYRDTTKKIPEIAKELGVSTILEGGVQRAGKRIRINAQLIDVNTDEHLWAETFDREMTVENIFDIQSEITRHIVKAVRGELTTEETDALDHLPTQNLDAYEAYLHAKVILNADHSQQKYQDAELWLEKAVSLDPEFAMAWALLVNTNAQAVWMGYDDNKARVQRTRDALNKATEFGPFLPETLVARAEYMYRIENNYDEAEIALTAASKAKPGDAYIFRNLAFAQRRNGKWEQAVNNLQMAFELDPEDLGARSDMIDTLVLMREYDRVEPLINAWSEEYPQAVDIQAYKLWLMIHLDGDLVSARNLLDQMEPNGGVPYREAITMLPFLERDFQAAIDIYADPRHGLFNTVGDIEATKLLGKSRAIGLMGDHVQSRKYAQQAIERVLEFQSGSSGTDSTNAQVLLSLALAYTFTGEMGKALEAINEACELIPESRDSYDGAWYSDVRSWILAKSGKRDDALREIERLLSIPGEQSLWTYYLDPSWDFFRDDERFNALIRPENLKESGQ